MRTPETCTLLIDPKRESDCELLSDALGMPLTDSLDEANGRFLLQFDEEGRLGIKDLADKRTKLFVPELSVRRGSQGVDPLMRAIGYRTHSVIDCTGGWATDAAHIAAHGINVIALERHPIVYALVKSALAFCTNNKITENLQWVHANSAEFLGDVKALPEVVYVDPMYPPRPGSAAVKKPLQLLQALLVDENSDPAALLAIARTKATERVVVKRPHYAAPLLGGKSGATEGKLVRFDIYAAVHDDQ